MKLERKKLQKKVLINTAAALLMYFLICYTLWGTMYGAILAQIYAGLLFGLLTTIDLLLFIISLLKGFEK